MAHNWTKAEEAFLDWYCIPLSERAPELRTQEMFAHELNVHHQTLQLWRKQDWFQNAYRQRMDIMNQGPERLQAIADALYEKAREGDTKAAALYFQYTGRLKPAETKVVIEDRRIEELSDSELQAIIAGGSAREYLSG
jgi:hypothetical protein